MSDAAGTPVRCSLSVEDVLDGVPCGSRIQRAIVRVHAGCAGTAAIRDVASVRVAELPDDVKTAVAAASKTGTAGIIVDFQRLVTVTRVTATGAAFVGAFAWNGTGFGTSSSLWKGEVPAGEIRFPETQTQRLLLAVALQGDPPSANAAVDVLNTKGTVVLPAPPSELALRVNGRLVWSRSGPSVARGDGAGGAFTEEVDVTAELQAAAAASAPTVISLSSTVPAELGLSHEITYLKVHDVSFAGHEARSFVAASEGETSVDVPLPAGAAEWAIQGLDLEISAELAPTRVEPAAGPLLFEDVQFVIDPDHALAVSLSPGDLDRFHALLGVRLPVLVDAGQAELTAVLCAQDGSGWPGAPLPGPPLGPVSIEARAGGAATWTSLLSARPLRLSRAGGLWLVIAATRGRATIPAAGWNAGSAPNNPILTGPPDGPFVVPPHLPELAPAGFGAPLRLVGESAALSAIDLWLGDGAGCASLTPSRTGTRVALVPDPAITGDDADAITTRGLKLGVLAHTAGTFKLRSVKVLYTD